jgi:prepilin-type N-terminal cleavage/methylation domain-containing protein
MEEKRNQKSHASLRSVFNFKYNYQSLLRKFDLSSSPSLLRALNKNRQSSIISNKSIHGFTLIELLVVIIMLGILATFIIVALNPFKQIHKSQDAQRQQDIKQLISALDTYYNDKNCYPAVSPKDQLPTGGQAWPYPAGSTVYIQKVPIDPTFKSGSPNYFYAADNSSCPQWNVIFAQLSKDYNSSLSLCPLADTCRPNGFAGNNYYCAISGKVACDTLKSFTMGDDNTIPQLPVAGSEGNPVGAGTGCTCASTTQHASRSDYDSQSCQGGGVDAPSIPNHSTLNFFCNSDTHPCGPPTGNCCGNSVTNPAITCD